MSSTEQINTIIIVVVVFLIYRFLIKDDSDNTDED